MRIVHHLCINCNDKKHNDDHLTIHTMEMILFHLNCPKAGMSSSPLLVSLNLIGLSIGAAAHSLF